jgi:hypothetical protein
VVAAGAVIGFSGRVLEISFKELAGSIYEQYTLIEKQRLLAAHG